MDSPTQIRRLANFTMAAIGHLLRGLPTCTQEQIDQRLAICRQCDIFQPSDESRTNGYCGHEHCGCNISQEKKFLNKLAWADQHCPLDKW